MATIEQYKTGWVPKASKMAVDLMQSTQGVLLETDHGKMIYKEIQSFAPMRLNEKQAFALIDDADMCAVGERSCKCNYEDAPYSETVFLNELAEAVVASGKARWVDKETAKASIKKYSGLPIITSKVSGRYMEICRSWPKKCIYWNMEMHKVRCIKRINKCADIMPIQE